MDAMRVAVIGGEGQLGTDLMRGLGGSGISLTHAEIEITDRQSVAECLSRHRPDAVVNTAAYNKVDLAEKEATEAFRVNALGARVVAEVCGEMGIAVMHVSTDHVFGLDEGRRVPYRVSDAAGPVSVYGNSKLSGEYFVRGLATKHYVVRTCGLYGRAVNRTKGNFVKTMLKLAGEREELKIVNDQWCTPSATADVAKGMIGLLRSGAYGVHHVTNRGEVTWYEFACEIMQVAGKKTRIVPISSGEFGAAARRPAYSVLDCGETERAAGVAMRDWRDALGEYLRGE